MRYRGDHYQLAARLGKMIAERHDSGPEISPADNLCGFGKWRARFEAGQEPFSQNPNLRRAMDLMTGPHREFHQTAAALQRLIRAGFDDNGEEITRVYIEHLNAAAAVVSTFDQIADEAERARELYAGAETYVMGDLRQARAQMLKTLGDFMAANQKNMDANLSAAITTGNGGVRAMQIFSLSGMILGIAIMVILYITVRNQLTGPLSRVIAALANDANTVMAEAEGVAGSSNSLSEGANSQAAALEETSAAVEEITSMARRNLDNAANATEIVQANTAQIHKSAGAVERMSTAMDEIRSYSEKIGLILKTIEEIAFQTNLLALNAAVEAARAGEAGKGFAVVADEVRNLAQRSALAVQETAELITGTVERVNNGVHITAEIEKDFSRITESTTSIARMITEIHSATSEQTQGMDQINTSIAEIDTVNQNNVKHAENNANASVNLNTRAGNLMELIGDLGHVLETITGRKTMPAHAAAHGTPPPSKRSLKMLPPPGA